MKISLITRLASWLFSIIIFSVMASLIDRRRYCPMNDYSACQVGLAFGVITFFVAMMFCYYDFNINERHDLKFKRNFVICDLVISFLLSLLWIALFLYLAIVNRPYESDTSAVVAFAFFSILSWSYQTYLAYQSSKDADFQYYTELTLNRDSEHHYRPVVVHKTDTITKQDPY